MESLLTGLYHICGQIYLPPEILTCENLILHISDTPAPIYWGITKLVKKLKPNIIIHTGDLVDDIKLELYPGQIDRYIRGANALIKDISPYVRDSIYIVPGNHDNIDSLKLNEKVRIISETNYIELNGMKFGAAHKFEDLPDGCDFYLYGHDKTTVDSGCYLNGIININIIDMNKIEVTKLLYPIGTDDYRLKKSRIGI